MRKMVVLMMVVGMWPMPVWGDLIDRGVYLASTGQEVTLIYDTDQDVTWLGDLNFARTSGHDSDGLMNWFEAMAWADDLVIEGFDEWRLPQADPNCWLYCPESEMGHIWQVDFGRSVGDSLGVSADPFYNSPLIYLNGSLRGFDYWTSTDWFLDPNAAVSFSFSDFDGGAHFFLSKERVGMSLAVMDGDVLRPPGQVSPSTQYNFEVVFNSEIVKRLPYSSIQTVFGGFNYSGPTTPGTVVTADDITNLTVNWPEAFVHSLDSGSSDYHDVLNTFQADPALPGFGDLVWEIGSDLTQTFKVLGCSALVRNSDPPCDSWFISIDATSSLHELGIYSRGWLDESSFYHSENLFSRITITPQNSPIPEPSSWFLFGTGIAGLMFWRYRKPPSLRSGH